MIRLEEKIRSGKKYRYRYSLFVPYKTPEAFEPSVNLTIARIKQAFPSLSQLVIAYATMPAGTIPSTVDLVFTFGQDPFLTHQEFQDRVKQIASQVYWTLQLQEITLLEGATMLWPILLALGLMIISSYGLYKAGKKQEEEKLPWKRRLSLPKGSRS